MCRNSRYKPVRSGEGLWPAQLMRQEDRHEALATGAVIFVEAAGNRAVEIEHPEHAAIIDQRHDQLRSRLRIAGDVAGKFMHIGYDDRAAVGRGGAANPFAPRNADTGRLALKRAEDEVSPPR